MSCVLRISVRIRSPLRHSHRARGRTVLCRKFPGAYMEVKAMQRSRPPTALVRLPALARAGEGRAARRYLRERTKTFAPERPAGVTPPRRPDGVRELTVTSVQRPRRDRCSRATYVPWLRLSGRWLGEPRCD